MLANFIAACVISSAIVLAVMYTKKLKKNKTSVNRRLDELVLMGCQGLNPEFGQTFADNPRIKCIPEKSLQFYLDYAEGLPNFSEAFYRTALKEYHSLKGTYNAEVMLSSVLELCDLPEFDERTFNKLKSYADALGLDINDFI